MKIFGRIALVVAILACGGALFFANKLGKDRNDLRVVRDGLIGDKTKLTADLATTTETLKNTKQTLDRKSEELVATLGTLEGTKASLAQKSQEAETLKQTVADKSRDLEQVKGDLATVQKTMDQITKSMKDAGLDDISNIDQLRDKIVNQTEDFKILGRQMIVMRDENNMLKAKVEELSTTPVNLRGTVAEVQNNWGFVVLDLGKNQRVQPNTNFLVYRDTKLVGKVQVRAVGQAVSVAEVLPEYLRAVLRVGDLVVH